MHSSMKHMEHAWNFAGILPRPNKFTSLVFQGIHKTSSVQHFYCNLNSTNSASENRKLLIWSHSFSIVNEGPYAAI